ncbi:sigma-54-dependent transcriptional regulator [Desulfogranum japonicum]|uniref:sigma-54-dependent transcriptional regulator n=1 Tax=Desulfogranum japonicum TaxID=231447 RepID=UPI00041FCF5E|nr:sigma-54 dependent transcriptional regulator [Desulfogranum japonicum]
MITQELRNCQILLIDDEQSELDAYSMLLQSMGIKKVITLQDSRKTLQTLDSLYSPIIFLDLNMPYLSGQEVLQQLKQAHPQVPVIIITANSEIETAVECLRMGAHDYLVKPIDLKMFSSALRNALEINILRHEVMSLKGISFGRDDQRHPAFQGIITQNPAMLSIFHYIESVAESGMPVLILGETGSGKELLAKAIHDISNVSGKYVTVDVSGLDDTLFSDTLFGHTKGAYTGAGTVRSGLLEQAHNGTIFLDEIGDLSEVSQVKLLRLLQEKTYYPLGSDHPKTSTARIITAANKDLTVLAGQQGEFRMDLYYRLSTHLIRIPPLRDRREDIPLIVAYLAQKAGQKMGKEAGDISDEALQMLMRHPFWGNVRELKTYVDDAVARSQSGRIEKDLIAERLQREMEPQKRNREVASLTDLFGTFPTLEELTEKAVQEAMEVAEHNQSQAARLLGISRQAVNKRISKLKS